MKDETKGKISMAAIIAIPIIALFLAGRDVYNFKYNGMRRHIHIPERNFVYNEPDMGFWDSYIHDRKVAAEPHYGEAEIYESNVAHTVNMVDAIGEKESYLMDGMLDLLYEEGQAVWPPSHKSLLRYDDRVVDACMMAIDRMDRNVRRRVLGKIMYDPPKKDNKDVESMAAKRLMKIDPNYTTSLLIRRSMNGRNPYSRGHFLGFKYVHLPDIFIEIGSEKALRFLLDTGDKELISDFVAENRGKGFLQYYKWNIIEHLVSEFYCGNRISDITLSGYARAVRSLDPWYAENLWSKIENEDCFGRGRNYKSSAVRFGLTGR